MRCLLILLCILFVGCGSRLTPNRSLFTDINDRIDDIDSRVDGIDARVSLLETAYTNMGLLINSMDAQVEALEVLLSAQGGDIASMQASIAALEASLLALQAQQNTLLVDIVELQGNDSIAEFIDPCGDGPGFDEVILQTSSGKLVAYFESGSKRFLSLLTPGNYVTTDQQACNFTVNGAGELVW